MSRTLRFFIPFIRFTAIGCGSSGGLRKAMVVAVVDPIGKRLKIPAWMLSPVAGKAEIALQAYLSRESLLSLVRLVESTGEKSDNLLQTSADKSKGDRHAATATAKPGSNTRRTRNRRSSGSRRSARSHGTHFGDGVSSTGKGEG